MLQTKLVVNFVKYEISPKSRQCDDLNFSFELTHIHIPKTAEL